MNNPKNNPFYKYNINTLTNKRLLFDKADDWDWEMRVIDSADIIGEVNAECNYRDQSEPFIWQTKVVWKLDRQTDRQAQLATTNTTPVSHGHSWAHYYCKQPFTISVFTYSWQMFVVRWIFSTRNWQICLRSNTLFS